jgi:FlaA1/EpsC-like NDP-sugar epimerase
MPTPLRTVLIVGAGQAGQWLTRDLRDRAAGALTPVGFVDDDPARLGSITAGLPVLGATVHLPEIVARYRIDEILIAIPSATGVQLRRITALCQQSGVPFRTAPSVDDLPECRLSLRQVRDVRIEDLLGRQPVKLDRALIAANLQGQVVLVTGAGGSIGSELARQVAAGGAGRLVLLDRAESELYELEQALRSAAPTVDLAPVVSDVLDAEDVREVFRRYRPTRVYHAAAYKQVPVMERHPVAAARHNVIGTAHVLDAAAAAGSEQFVLMSTDKAVRPTSVMGATKRAAERVVLTHDAPGLRRSVVRFGNVLGSRGSVVPLFQRQIAAGGPVTVTHPDVVRYFMTVHEAVQLVLQASAMARGGEIFHLDMGELVRIADLAEQLIRLSGLEPGRDVAIQFVGLRPGDKLTEELLVSPDEVEDTVHPRVKMVRRDGRNGLPARWLPDLYQAVHTRNAQRVLALIGEAVPDYRPSAAAGAVVAAAASRPTSPTN